MTRAEVVENLHVAMDTLRGHKVRSMLTILGIVIGVTSVISVAAIIDGLNGYIQNKVDSFGPRTYWVTRCPPGSDPQRLPESVWTCFSGRRLPSRAPATSPGPLRRPPGSRLAPCRRLPSASLPQRPTHPPQGQRRGF